MTPGAVLAVAAVFGACIGSFLNVVIYRLPLGQSLVTPPSRCPKCGYRLRVVRQHSDLRLAAAGRPVPQVRHPISIQYPIVELITGAVVRAGGVAHAARSAAGQPAAARVHPDRALRDRSRASDPAELDHAARASSSACSSVSSRRRDGAMRCSASLLGAGILYAIAGAYYLWRREEGLGMGDVKMLAMIGAFLGWKAVLVTLVLSSFSGARDRRGADRRAARRHEAGVAVRHVPRHRRAGGDVRRRAAGRLVRGVPLACMPPRSSPATRCSASLLAHRHPADHRADARGQGGDRARRRGEAIRREPRRERDAVDGAAGCADEAETAGTRDGRARRSVGAARRSDRRRPDLRPGRRRSRRHGAVGEPRGAAHSRPERRGRSARRSGRRSPPPPRWRI